MGSAQHHDPRTRQSFYSTVRPEQTVLVDCQAVDCEMYEEGWRTIVAADGEKAAQIRTLDHGRHFTEQRVEGGMAVFTFPSGQQCFAEHRIGAAPPKLLHFDGRGGTGPVGADDVRLAIRHRELWRPPDWIEKFREETEKTAELRAQEGV